MTSVSSITLQLFWTPDVIIHDLVRFNKPEILNQVGALGKDPKKFPTKNILHEKRKIWNQGGLNIYF